MDWNMLLLPPGEKPLEHIPADGGFCGIFRTIGCIGDSLSSGEFESLDRHGNPGYHDYFDYSWGQYLARLTGAKVYNFSRGGMTAKEYWDSFAESNRFWDKDKLCQAYILALGVNDISRFALGSAAAAEDECPENEAETFAGYYCKIIRRYRCMQPRARFFFMTMVHNGDPAFDALVDQHAMLLHDLAVKMENTYVIDLAKYAPVYDAEFRRNFYLGGHMNPAGYLLTGRMVAAYIDYIVRHNMEDFAQVGFIGTELYHRDAIKF